MGSDGVERTGLSRRDALKRGAVVGGSMLWVTPLVQSMTITPAFAQATSPGGHLPPTTTPPGGGGTTTTTTPPGGGTTTTTTPGGGGTSTTTTTSTTSTTVQVQGEEITRSTGGSAAPAGQTALPQVLGTEVARAPSPASPASVADRLASTGANLGDLAALGGASTALGTAAVAWSSRRRRPARSADPTDQADEAGPDDTPAAG